MRLRRGVVAGLVVRHGVVPTVVDEPGSGNGGRNGLPRDMDGDLSARHLRGYGGRARHLPGKTGLGRNLRGYGDLGAGCLCGHGDLTGYTPGI